MKRLLPLIIPIFLIPLVLAVGVGAVTLTALNISSIDYTFSNANQSFGTYNQIGITFLRNSTSSSNVSIVNGGRIDINNGNFTVMARVRKETSNSDLGRIVEIGNTTGSLSYLAYMQLTADNKLYCFINNSNGISGTIAYNDTSFHLLTCSFTAGPNATVGGTARITSWFDTTTQVDTSVSKNITMLNTKSDIIIGKRNDNAKDNLNGTMDWFALYNLTMVSGHVATLNYSIDHGSFIAVVSYHGVQQDCSGDATTVCTDNFSAQMKYLNDSGYKTITLKQLQMWKDGNLVDYDKYVILVFDDAWRTVYTNASTIMNTYGYKGVVAVPTNYIDEDATRLNTSEIRSLVYDYGWELASHSVNHTSLLTLSPSERAYQFSQSKTILDSLFNYNVTAFIYPGNSQNLTLQSECSGYYFVCLNDSWTSVNTSGFVFKETNNIGGINRYNVLNSTDLFSFYRNAFFLGQREVLLNFNENTGSIAHDSSLYSNNATLNMTTWENDGVTKTNYMPIFTEFNNISSLVTLPAIWNYLFFISNSTNVPSNYIYIKNFNPTNPFSYRFSSLLSQSPYSDVRWGNGSIIARNTDTVTVTIPAGQYVEVGYYPPPPRTATERLSDTLNTGIVFIVYSIFYILSIAALSFILIKIEHSNEDLKAIKILLGVIIAGAIVLGSLPLINLLQLIASASSVIV